MKSATHKDKDTDQGDNAPPGFVQEQPEKKEFNFFERGVPPLPLLDNDPIITD